MSKILYSSADIRKEIISLFRTEGRRVAISAFVGKGADSYLPNAKGLELICWKKGGGTNPDELRNLIAKGAIVQFADNVHMKIYWSEKGAIISSANLSMNALGSGDLKEIGVLLPSDAVNIDKVLNSLLPRKVTKKELDELDFLHKQYYSQAPKFLRYSTKTFIEWYELRPWKEWKFAIIEGNIDLSETAKQKALNEYGVVNPYDWMNCRKDDYQDSDWILTFNLKKVPRNLDWMYVNFTVDISPSDRTYSQALPCQLVQLAPSNRYGPPPFSLRDHQFRLAFIRACRDFTPDKLLKMKKTQFPDEFIELIKENYK